MAEVCLVSIMAHLVPPINGPPAITTPIDFYVIRSKVKVTLTSSCKIVSDQ